MPQSRGRCKSALSGTTIAHASINGQTVGSKWALTRDTVMKEVCRSRASIFLLVLSIGLLMAACRSTPVAPPSEPRTEGPESEQPQDDGSKIAMPPASPAETASKPAQETIARHLPESRIGKPEKDLAARRVEYNTVLNTRANGAPRSETAWRYRATRRGEIVGFEFSNYGGNRILPPHRDAAKNQFFSRDFQFRFDERARQDIHLLVSDWVASRDRTFRLSELMNSLMLFFPRNFLPAIVNAR